MGSSANIPYVNPINRLQNKNLLNQSNMSSKISDGNPTKKNKLKIPDICITCAWGTLRLVPGNNFLCGSIVDQTPHTLIYQDNIDRYYTGRTMLSYGYYKNTKHPYVQLYKELLLDDQTKIYIDGAETQFSDEIISLIGLGREDVVTVANKVTAEFIGKRIGNGIRLEILEPNSHFVWESNEWCMKCSLAEINKYFENIKTENPMNFKKLKISELVTKYSTVTPSSDYISFGKVKITKGSQKANLRPVEICGTLSGKWYTFRLSLSELTGCKFTEEKNGKAIRTINIFEYLSYTPILSHTMPIHWRFMNGELICQVLSDERVWQPDTVVELRVRVDDGSDTSDNIKGNTLPEYV